MSSIPLGGSDATLYTHVECDVTAVDPPHSPNEAHRSALAGTCTGSRHASCAGRACTKGLAKPLGRPTGYGAPTFDGSHRRRPSRLRETSRTNVTAAIPPGSLAVDHTLQTWRALLELPGYQLARKDRRLTLARVLWVLMRCADFDTMTTRPTWAVLQERTGRSRNAVATALRQLRAWGLLGIVASGRQADHAAKGADGQRCNEAAVYVLCRPAGRGLRALPVLPQHAEAVARREGVARLAVEEKNTPPAKRFSPTQVEGTSHAREEKNPDVEPLRGPESSRRGASAAQPHHSAHRQELTWERHRTMASDGSRLAGLSTLRNLNPALRVLSLPDLRSLMRHHLDAGYTVADLHHALNTRPSPDPRTGREHWGALPEPRHHQTPVDHQRVLREVLRHRLACWITPAGEVMRSPDQRISAEATRLHAQHRAYLARRAGAEATRESLAPVASSWAARIREDLAARRSKQ